MSINRRTFIRTSIATGAALAFPSIITAGRVKTYRTALIGSGWWGMNIASEAIASGRCKMVALCDVDPSRLDA
ncbi:MAG: twin-arginine translocation signal domain-containing protein, partial [Sedimentisphaerales bacterium]|nr:twin-arginine translocation signal domain-containing protein [Sedimentisphaerales bacterium]